MDFGIKGKRALVCASSKGLGRGCAEALAGEGVNLVINSRTAEVLEQTAQEIRDQYGVEVIAGAADIIGSSNRCTCSSHSARQMRAARVALLREAVICFGFPWSTNSTVAQAAW